MNNKEKTNYQGKKKFGKKPSDRQKQDRRKNFYNNPRKSSDIKIGDEIPLKIKRLGIMVKELVTTSVLSVSSKVRFLVKRS